MNTNEIETLLNMLGIGHRFCGHAIALEAIRIAAFDEDLILCCRQNIFRPMAKRHNCPPCNIERNLRTVIQHAWLTNPQMLQRIAGYPLDKAPGVTEFIDIVVTYLLRHRPGDSK